MWLSGWKLLNNGDCWRERGSSACFYHNQTTFPYLKKAQKWQQSLFSREKMFSFYPTKSLIYQLPLLVVKKFDMPKSNVTDRTLVQSPSKSPSFSKCCLSVVSSMEMWNTSHGYVKHPTWWFRFHPRCVPCNLQPHFQMKQETISCQIMFIIQKSNCVSKLEAGIWSMLNSSSQPTIPLMIQYAVNNQAAGCYNQSDTNFEANKFMQNLFFPP